MMFRQAQHANKKSTLNLPKGWEMKKLNEIFEVKSSRRVHKADWKNEGVPFYRAREVVKLAQNGFVDNDLFISEELFKEFTKDKGAPKEGDIIISAVGTLGQCYLVKKDDRFYFKDASVLWFENTSNVNPIYIEYAFKSDLVIQQVLHKSMGATVGTLTISRARKIQIPIPPLSEQKQIVAILDKAFTAIDQAQANIEKNIANAKELFQSKLNAVFSYPSTGSGGKANTEPAEVWEEKKIKDVATVIAGQSPQGKYYNDNGIGMPFYQGKKEFTDRFIGEPKVWTSHLTKEAIKGDVLMSVRAPVGPVNFATQKCCIGRGLAAIRIKIGFDENFLFYYFKNIENQLIGNTGAVFNSINKAQIENLIIPVVNINIQREIVTQLDLFQAQDQNLTKKYYQKLNYLEDLKKSLLQKAFSGALTSTRWISPTAKIIPLQPVTGISTTDLQAGITALALQKHIAENQQHTFHHVKAEKIIHLSEYILNIDLDRNPTKDAAGPNDFPHAKKVESRARKAGFYSVIKKEGYYEYEHRRRMDSIIEKTQNCLGEKVDILSQIIDTLIPMKTKQVEIVATLYAAWNNLLIRKEVINDEAIVYEARENWHKSKLNIERERFFKAIEWMKKHDFLIPKGNGKLIQAKSN